MAGGSRLVQIAFVFVLAAAGIVWRLFDLQIRHHDFWEHEAVVARTREQSIPCRRGEIRDCFGRPLAASRTVFDLDFVFSSLRKRTATGQLLAARYLLTGERLSLARVLARPGPLLEQFATVTVGEMRAIEPGERREDLLTYAVWLAGLPRTRVLVERLRSGSATELVCPELNEQRGAILSRLRAERESLAQLERAVSLAPGELVTRIDDDIREIDERVQRIAGRTDRGSKTFAAERELHKDEDLRPRLLVKNVPHSIVFDLERDPGRLPGIVAAERTRRIYPEENDVCPLIIGRVGPPSPEALAAVEKTREAYDECLLRASLSAEDALALQQMREELNEECVLTDEEVGKEGLEAAFERVLRGRRGSRRCESDRAGDEQIVLEQEPPIGGCDVVLTLDSVLQRAAEQILAGGVPETKGGPKKFFPGAVVLIELPEMKVRVLASAPSPTRAEVAANYEAMVADTTLRPLHPRAWKPALPPPPGSSIKPLVAAMALSAGIISPRSTYHCDKSSLRARDGGPPVRCEGLHNDIDVHDAIVHSCNHYFAQLAQDAGWERMVEWSHDFGFGERTGFTSVLLNDGTELRGLGDEASGTARQERGGRNLMLFGIGQGKIDSTPLQVAAAVGALALRAYQPPTLIERVGDEAPRRFAPIALPITEAAWNEVVGAMRLVTHPGGTASPDHGYDLSLFDLATKTGTPQQGRKDDLDHSWFVGFFPSRAPRYAFAIFLERTGRHGGEAAAPILAYLLADPNFAEIAASARAHGDVSTDRDTRGDAR